MLDLNDAVANMLTMLRRLIGESIELAWKPGLELWCVKIDPSQVDQILANLCVNARDAIKGVGTVTVETRNVTVDETVLSERSAPISGDFVQLTVSDTGCGMTPETAARVFDPFFTTKGLAEGTGLGLATVYGIVKQNGGDIHLYSEPGQGTVLKIYLPRHAGATESAEPPAAAVPSIRGRETVLLVEDDPMILTVCKGMLESLGYRVLHAEGPVGAIELAEQKTDEIHLLLSDVVMPGLTGRDVADRLRSSHPKLKCLFMSGYTSDVIADHGVLAAGVHFLQKPFSRHALSVKIREVLGDG